MLVKLINATIVGVIGGIAVWTAVKLNLVPWVLFLSWVCYFVFGPDLKAAAWALVQIIIGTLLAVLVLLLNAAFAPALGVWAIVGIVFVLVTMIGLLEDVPPMNTLPAYYIGLVTFMASGLPPAPSSLVTVILPILAGFGFGWVTVIARTSFAKFVDSRSSRPVGAA